jgi:predicted glutamine amidotransferase
MCRFTFYLGPRILLSSLLTEPSHSLIRQSSHSREREEPLNGDGFGVGWYAHEYSPEPAVFRSITPAWNNRNLQNLARVVASTCIMAHVRAATQASGVNEANCHPFRYGRYLCMHNGEIGNFHAVRRQILGSVCDEAFGNVYGSTDTEHFFAVFIDELLRIDEHAAPLERMAGALSRAIARVIDIVRRHGGGAASHLNVAITDGEHAVVSRFADAEGSAPESLYYFLGNLYPRKTGEDLHGRVDTTSSVIVSSERLTPNEEWRAIEPNHMILLQRGFAPALRACL